jgi:uncharacterized protein YndB with AHSA1/START domain
MSALSEVIVNAPVVNVVSMFSEPDLFKQWMPNINDCVILKEVSNYRRLVHMKQALPWPMSGRDMVFRTSG